MKEKKSILEKIFNVKPENIGIKKLLFNPTYKNEYMISMVLCSAYTKNKIYTYLTLFKEFCNYNLAENGNEKNEYILNIYVTMNNKLYNYCKELYDVNTFYNNKKMIKKIVEIFKFKNLIR